MVVVASSSRRRRGAFASSSPPSGRSRGSATTAWRRASIACESSLQRDLARSPVAGLEIGERGLAVLRIFVRRRRARYLLALQRAAELVAAQHVHGEPPAPGAAEGAAQDRPRAAACSRLVALRLALAGWPPGDVVPVVPDDVARQACWRSFRGPSRRSGDGDGAARPATKSARAVSSASWPSDAESAESSTPVERLGARNGGGPPVGRPSRLTCDAASVLLQLDAGAGFLELRLDRVGLFLGRRPP